MGDYLIVGVHTDVQPGGEVQDGEGHQVGGRGGRGSTIRNYLGNSEQVRGIT